MHCLQCMSCVEDLLCVAFEGLTLAAVEASRRAAIARAGTGLGDALAYAKTLGCDWPTIMVRIYFYNLT